MRHYSIYIFILAVAAVSGSLGKSEESQEDEATWHKNPDKPELPSLFWSSGRRFKRQSEATDKPTTKKPRPNNIFSLISVLISETREDTNRALNEIGTLFNSQFSDVNVTTSKTTTSTSTSTSTSEASDNEEDNEITTTTEPFRISRDEFLGILRSNVQGLAQLLRKEVRLAIKDSNQNAREFGRDLGLALRPFFN